ncbi:MAG: hypothetical protein KA715_05395 [Xanthomonadaceae bacterium]|nr:hypothetical protein [Xanthomonadaceae bacterium]
MWIKRIKPIWFFYSLVAIYFVSLKFIFPSEGMGWQDDPHFLSPLPASQLFDRIVDYYMLRCGRLGETINLVFMNWITHGIGFTPFNFPWFTLRLLGGVVVSLSFGNFTHGILRMSGVVTSLPVYLIYLFGFVFLALSVPISEGMSLAIIHSNYCTPIFLTSLVFLWISREKIPSLTILNSLALTLFCWYISVIHEQLVFTMSILLPGITLFNYFAGRISWKQFLKHAVITLLIVGSSLVTVLLAPGQTARMKTLDPSGKTTLHLFWWVFESTHTLGKLMTLPMAWHGNLARPFLYILVALTIGLFIWIYRKRGKLVRSESRILYFSVLFLWMGYLTQITQLVSLYFPERARILPMHHYMIGLGLLALFLFMTAKNYLKNHYKAFEIAAISIGVMISLYRIPTQVKQGYQWWEAWNSIGTRAATFYQSLNAEALKSQSIIRFDYDACHIASVFYDVPESSLAIIRWAKLDQKVEVFSNGKIYNPLPKEWPRKTGNFPCDLGV